MKQIFLLFLLISRFAFTQGPGLEEMLSSFFKQFLKGEEGEEHSSFTSTSHTIDLPSGPFSYKAITGLLPQYLDDGQLMGQLFFTAYLKEEGDESRPISFIFDGGPGGSSMAMHIGGFGPRRLLLPEEGQKPLPPYRMIDNAETILDLSDLIFIDPVGTGYSEAEKPAYKRGCFGVEGDLSSFTEFTRMFCIYFNRWNSPKYLIGASYGSSRAIGLAESLTNVGISISGVALLSTAFDYHFLVHQRDLPFSNWLNIPSFAASSWYHKRTMQDKTLEEVLSLARRFAYEEYAPIMLQPSRLSAREQQRFYQSFADLIGLPLETVLRLRGRIDERTFTTEFFAADRKVLGGIDARYVGDVSSIYSEYCEDPSYLDLRSAFYPAFLNYLQLELETKKESKYITFSGEAFTHWDWATYDNPGLPSFLQRLRRTLVASPHMKVFIGSGYYDLRTPFAAMEYSIDHLELPDSYRKNFQIEYYPAGHGFIFNLPSLKKFKQDLRKFYEP